MPQLTPLPSTFTLDVNGLRIAGVRHTRKDNVVRMLCLHGWLDNANSFLPMMPYLPSIDLVAIDMPGHGYSDHSSAGYSLAEYAAWTLAIMDALEWEDCHLAGHSLGGCIASMVAAGCPERIQSLLMIEASGALSEEADAFPARLQRFLKERQTPPHLTAKRFSDKEQAVQSRLNATRMDPMSARLIIDRQMKQSDDGYRWRFDPRLRTASAQYQSEAQVHAILGAITCPTLTVVADDGFLARRSETADRLAQLKHHTSVNLTGHHHAHMDTPEPVAAAVNRFLGTTPEMGG